MGLNHKSQRIRAWADALHLKTEMHRPSFEKAIRLLTYILGETVSPFYYNYVKRELAKVLVAHQDLTIEQLKILGTLQDRLTKKFTLLQERAERRKAKKAAEKEAKQAKQSTSVTPAEEVTPWDKLNL